ncbi:MAG: GDP-mannose 4,6-dehydratase [Candidatus Sedimenticola sp. PURPLELP]
MKVLVTGLDGFTGWYLHSELKRSDCTVVGLQSDLTDCDSVFKEVASIKPDAVIHLAGISFVGHKDVNEFYKVNLIGTRNLLAALEPFADKLHGVLLISSANVYGNQSECLLKESWNLDPANDYAVSKLSMEQMARLWMNRLPVFIARPFNYTGIGQDDKFIVPKLVHHFKHKMDVIELGNMDVYREFGDVRGVAKAYAKLLNSAPVGNVYNVCTSKAYSLEQVIGLFESITGHNINIHVNKKYVRDNEVKYLAGDNERLNQLIGNWQDYSLEDTLEWMLYGAKELANSS